MQPREKIGPPHVQSKPTIYDGSARPDIRPDNSSSALQVFLNYCTAGMPA